MVCEVDQNGNEIFIIDEETVRNFFADENFELAQMFFDYLTIHCKTKKAYILPSIFKKIKDRIVTKTKDKGSTIQTEVISYFENWVREANLLGEEKGDEINDTLLLLKILKFLHPDKKIIILSSKYSSYNVDSLSLEDISSYLLSKENFKEYLKKTYGLNDGASY